MAWLCAGWLALGMVAMAATVCRAAAQKQEVGENLASGKTVQFKPAPNYALCTDPGDPSQLTDGKLANTNSKMWVQKPFTVGWQRMDHATMTVDLGKVQPIAGVKIHTSAGLAGVEWPVRIQLLVSDDGKAFHDLGNLVGSKPLPDGQDQYRTHWYQLDSLKSHGRYVRLIVQLGKGYYFFTDEIVVTPGEKSWLDRPLPGQAIPDTEAYFRKTQARVKSTRRIERDLEQVQQQVSGFSSDHARMQSLLDELKSLRQRMEQDPEAVQPDPDAKFLPYNDLDRQILAVWGKFLAADGQAPLTAAPANPWDDLPWVGHAKKAEPIKLQLMRRETRPAAVNLTNATGEPMTVEVTVEGLPRQAGLQEVDAVGWTDTGSGIPIADALIRLEPADGHYTLKIPAGVTQQLWLRFKPSDSGHYKGRLVARSRGAAKGQSAQTPIELSVLDLDFPAKPHLHTGGWDYTNPGSGMFRNRPDSTRIAAARLLQAYGVDTPWATNAVLPDGKYDSQGNMTEPPDLSAFDQWIKLWPDAAKYAIFQSGGNDIAGLKIGTPAFKKAVGQWAQYFAKHARSRGIDPSRILMLYVDEPSTPPRYKPSVAWANAVAASGAGLTAWTDPIPQDPTTMPEDFQKVFEVFCFNRSLILRSPGKFQSVAEALRKAGKRIEVYGTKGPMKEQDPYAYVRLQAWRAWSLGAEACSFWSYMDNGGVSDWLPYAPRGTGEPYTPLFLDKDSVMPAKHLAAVRAGAEDYEYLYMLRQALQRTDKNKLDSDLVARGRKLLASAPDRVLNGPGIDGKYDNLQWRHPKDRTMADIVRHEIAAWLLAAR